MKSYSDVLLNRLARPFEGIGLDALKHEGTKRLTVLNFCEPLSFEVAVGASVYFGSNSAIVTLNCPKGVELKPTLESDKSKPIFGRRSLLSDIPHRSGDAQWNCFDLAAQGGKLDRIVEIFTDVAAEVVILRNK